MRLSVIVLMLFYAAAPAADLVVAVTETKTGQEKFFRVEPESLSMRKTKAAHGEVLTKIERYKIEKRKLMPVAGDESLMKTDNILFQCSAGDTDFVVVRQEYNSLCCP